MVADADEIIKTLVEGSLGARYCPKCRRCDPSLHSGHQETEAQQGEACWTHGHGRSAPDPDTQRLLLQVSGCSTSWVIFKTVDAIR